MKIIISKPLEKELQELQVKRWPIWEKEVSKFPWFYDNKEICYILEGEIIVETAEETLTITSGDLVIFPAGLQCVWDIRKSVKKHYNFPE